MRDPRDVNTVGLTFVAKHPSRLSFYAGNCLYSTDLLLTTHSSLDPQSDDKYRAVFLILTPEWRNEMCLLLGFPCP